MGIKNDLIALLNTLNTVETKGESTKRMGTCLQFLEGLIQKCDDKPIGSAPDSDKVTE